VVVNVVVDVVVEGENNPNYNLLSAKASKDCADGILCTVRESNEKEINKLKERIIKLESEKNRLYAILEKVLDKD